MGKKVFQGFTVDYDVIMRLKNEEENMSYVVNMLLKAYFRKKDSEKQLENVEMAQCSACSVSYSNILNACPACLCTEKVQKMV